MAACDNDDADQCGRLAGRVRRRFGAFRAEPVAMILEGRTTAKDGDGVLFGQVESGLWGIAAPE